MGSQQFLKDWNPFEEPTPLCLHMDSKVAAKVDLV